MKWVLLHISQSLSRRWGLLRSWKKFLRPLSTSFFTLNPWQGCCVSLSCLEFSARCGYCGCCGRFCLLLLLTVLLRLSLTPPLRILWVDRHWGRSEEEYVTIGGPRSQCLKWPHSSRPTRHSKLLKSALFCNGRGSNPVLRVSRHPVPIATKTF